MPLAARWRFRHVPLTRLVDLAVTSPWSPAQVRDWNHVVGCGSCLPCFRQVADLLASPPPPSASEAETTAAVSAVRSRLIRSLTEASGPSPAARLIDTRAGDRVTRALALWLGDAAARAMLKRARAGRDARRDVLTAIAQPLTAFLGEQAGRALAVKVSRLADADHDGPLEIQA